MSQQRLIIIDFLKGYSIFTIVLYHILQRFDLQGFFSLAINFGAAGIYVFILCSGFGLFLSQYKKPLPYFQFLRKRFFKIYIPYIIVISIAASIPFIYTGEEKWKAILSHIFLFKMFDERFVNSFGEQFWFISMIFQCYLAFPFLYRLVRKNCLRTLVLAIIISLTWPIIVSTLGKEDFRIWNSFFLQFLWVFVLGMVLAVRYIENKSSLTIPPVKTLLIFTIIGVSLTGLLGIQGSTLKLFNDIPSMVGYLSFALLVYLVNVKALNNFFIFTNQFSYEWYLIHMLVIDCILELGQVKTLNLVNGSMALIVSYSISILYNLSLKRIISISFKP